MAVIERKTQRYPTDLTDEGMRKVEPLLPRRSKHGRPRRVDLREIMNALRYLVRTGCGWRMLPKDFPPWATGDDPCRSRRPFFASDQPLNDFFKRTLIDSWLARSLELYADRVLPVTTGVARRWGVLNARMGHASADLLIAATALDHGLIVATRHLRHFAPTGVATENPFAVAA